MINPSGSVTVNGITDNELAEIIEIKAKHAPNVFGFNPQQLQPTNNGQQTIYNNAVFSWNGEQGLAVVQEVILFLLKKDEKAKAEGQ
jgi:hypothetical protein